MAESGWTVTTADAKIRIISWADKENKSFVSFNMKTKKKKIYIFFVQAKRTVATACPSCGLPVRPQNHFYGLLIPVRVTEADRL